METVSKLWALVGPWLEGLWSDSSLFPTRHCLWMRSCSQPCCVQQTKMRGAGKKKGGCLPSSEWSSALSQYSPFFINLIVSFSSLPIKFFLSVLRRASFGSMRYFFFFSNRELPDMAGLFEEWKWKFNFSLDGRRFLSFNYHTAWIPDGWGPYWKGWFPLCGVDNYAALSQAHCIYCPEESSQAKRGSRFTTQNAFLEPTKVSTWCLQRKNSATI